jgi:hypothetical protein
MNSDAVFGGAGAAGFGFDANGFHDELLVVLGGVLFNVPVNGLLFAAGFGAGVKACLVLDHIVDGAEVILLIIDGSGGGGAAGRIDLPLSCGTLLPKLGLLALAFFGGAGGSFFDPNGFKLLHDHPSPRAASTPQIISAAVKPSEANIFTASLLTRVFRCKKRTVAEPLSG